MALKQSELINWLIKTIEIDEIFCQSSFVIYLMGHPRPLFRSFSKQILQQTNL